MKRLLMTIGLVVNGLAFAQNYDQTNLEKYWKFRNTFREKFVKIGPSAGESLPAGALIPLDCVNNLNGDGPIYGEMRWGDGMIRHGHYLSVLATEYRLLKNAGQDLTGVLNELYYALNTVNRIDLQAETEQSKFYTSPPLPQNLNGFYLREDVPEDFAKNHWGTDPLKAYCTNSVFYRNNNAAKSNSEDYINRGNSYQNVPSLDQMTSLMIGFSLIHKLVDDIYIKPTPSDAGFNVVTETKQIVKRMMDFASQHNWFLIDVNGWPVANGGGDLLFATYPLCLAAQRMTGISYFNAGFARKTLPRYPDVQHCITGYGSNDSKTQAEMCEGLSIGENFLRNYLEDLGAGSYSSINNQSISAFQTWQAFEPHYSGNSYVVSALWNNLLTSDMVSDIISLPGNMANNFVKEYNKTITFNLAVVGLLWDNPRIKEWSDFTLNRTNEMIYAVLTNSTPTTDASILKDIMNYLSIEGPYNLSAGHYNAQGIIVHKHHENGWAGEYKWTNPYAALAIGGEEGIYNALDYMLVHNLYRLLYTSDGVYAPTNKCYCSPAISVPLTGTPGQILAKTNLNAKLSVLETCTPHVFGTANTISSNFDIYAKFPNYADLGIFTADYLTSNTTIAATGNVNVFNRFIICNAQTLTIQNGGKLNINKGETVINNLAQINAHGEIRVKSGTQLFIAGGRLTLNATSKLIIEDNAKVVIDYGSVLEYYNGAQIITEGANSEIVMRSTIKMMNAGTTFKINHSASAQSGRILMEGGRFIGAVAGTKVELTGKNNADEFIVLRENIPFIVDNVNIASFRIEKCNVAIPQGSSIRIEQPFYTETANFNSSASNGGITVTETAVFSRSHFNNTYIKAPLGIENVGTIKLVECSFSRSRPSLNSTVPHYLEVNGGGYEVYHTVFTNPRHTCIYSSAMTFPSKVQNSTFSHPSANGFGVTDYSATEIHLYGNSFSNFSSGVVKTNGKLSLRCNTFQNNTAFNAEAGLGTLLNMSSDDNAGYNEMYKTSTGQNIYLESASMNLANGYNFIEAGSGPIITGTYSGTCSIWTCLFYFPNNQWNSANTVPLPSKFNLVSANGNAMDIYTSPTALKPFCNPLGPVNPEGPGTAGKSMAAADGTPVIRTAFNDSISLREAITMGINKMEFPDTLGNDLEAIEIFNDVFTSDVSRTDSIAGPLLKFAFTQMKTAVENAFANGRITRTANATSLEPHVAMYVNALMYMSDSVIDASNYVQQYYHEMDKAHLFRLTGHSGIGMNILSGLENCGLDSTEQQHLNHWKAIFERDLITAEIGTGMLDTLIVIDTANYIAPQPLALNEYAFGARINSLYDIEYPNCDYYHSSKMTKAAAKPEFTLYPNPASDVVNIVLNHASGSGGTSVLTFQNAEGRLIHQAAFRETENKEKTLNVSDWKPGIYIYRYTIPDGKVFTGKLIVK